VGENVIRQEGWEVIDYLGREVGDDIRYGEEGGGIGKGLK